MDEQPNRAEQRRKGKGKCGERGPNAKRKKRNVQKKSRTGPELTAGCCVPSRLASTVLRLFARAYRRGASARNLSVWAFACSEEGLGPLPSLVACRREFVP
jgi:hypothetical protein